MVLLACAASFRDSHAVEWYCEPVQRQSEGCHAVPYEIGVVSRLMTERLGQLDKDGQLRCTCTGGMLHMLPELTHCRA